MKRAQRRMMGLAMFVAALMLMAGLMGGFGQRVSAQNDEEEAPHPAHVHTGSCAAPGDVVFPLSSVSEYGNVDGTPVAETGPVGADTAVPVETSVTDIKSSLADLLSSPHAIVVHESADAIQNYISCGDIGGTMVGASDLPVGLAALNDSGEAGVAWLHDNGDGTTSISIFLIYNEGVPEESEGDNSGTPEAKTGAATAAVAIEIKGFAYSQPMLEIPAGTTVTWTNNDQTAHTVSQAGGKGFESGKIDPGASFSFTFDTPGTYDYFCQFHANMKATVVVK